MTDQKPTIVLAWHPDHERPVTLWRHPNGALNASPEQDRTHWGDWVEDTRPEAALPQSPPEPELPEGVTREHVEAFKRLWRQRAEEAEAALDRVKVLVARADQEAERFDAATSLWWSVLSRDLRVAIRGEGS